MDDTADWFESYVYGIDRLDVGHAHGTAEDVPGSLEAIAGTDEQAALTAAVGYRRHSGLALTGEAVADAHRRLSREP